MGGFLLFILLVFLFLFFGVLGVVGKLLGGVFRLFRGGASSFGGGNFSSEENTESENVRGGQSESGVRRMKRFKSWAEDASFEESEPERVEVKDPVYEEMTNK